MANLFSAKTFKAWLLVGTLDISAACIDFYIETNRGPEPVLRYIARAVFGSEAHTGGNIMIMWGLIFHYLVALSFTLFFFFLCSKIPSILKYKVLTGFIYGIFIWSTMQFLVLPLTNVPKPKFPPDLINATKAILILIVCIGLPLAFIAGSNNRLKNSR